MARSVDLSAPMHLVRGSDEVLLNDAVLDLVNALVGDGDRSLMLEEFTAADTGREPGDDEVAASAPSGDADPLLVAAVNAARTPAFLTPSRVVVLRNAGQFGKAVEVAPLIDYLASPEPGTSFVVVWEAPPKKRLATVPKKLKEALKAAGAAEIGTDAGSNTKARGDWWADHLKSAAVRFDPRAASLVRERLADDVGELSALVSRLVAVHGSGTTLTVDDVEPYLGRAGSVPPWDLTDAIDRGDTSRSLDMLHRMLGAGDRHPLQIMATLQSHYLRMLRLDGSGARTEQAAADRLGMKGSTYPAKKARDQAEELGHSGVARAVALLAEADVTLRGGGRSWPGELVLEVLVARLSRLGGAVRGGRSRR